MNAGVSAEQVVPLVVMGLLLLVVLLALFVGFRR